MRKILLIFICAFLSCNSNTNKEENLKWDLWHIAQNQVKKQLKAPATANFHLYGGINETVSVYEANGDTTIYNIKGTVDSQNSYGALLTSSFECKLTVSEEGIFLKDLVIK